MSSKVILQGTSFVSVNGGTTYGFRLYDEYAKVYDNNSETLIEDDLELLKYAASVEDTDGTQAILNFVFEQETGMEINGTWYDWDEIKAVIGG